MDGCSVHFCSAVPLDIPSRARAGFWMRAWSVLPPSERERGVVSPRNVEKKKSETLTRSR